MELAAKQTYREPSFEIWPGGDTIGMDISEEHKAQMLADFPEKLEVIEDVEAYTKEKTARLAAAAEKYMQEILAQYEDPASIFKSDPMTSKDSFEKEKDFEPETKEDALEIETPEAKQPKGKRK